MQFALCLALGCLHPDQLMSQLTSRQYTEWLQYYKCEPWGDQRADLRAGIISAAQWERHRTRGEEPKTPADFMPFTQQKKQSPDEIKATLRRILNRR